VTQMEREVLEECGACLEALHGMGYVDPHWAITEAGRLALEPRS
jgi:hypothetical protein